MTIKRLPLVLVVMLSFAAGRPRAAEAGVWDWIQELSGPGPSDGNFNILFTQCPTKGLFSAPRPRAAVLDRTTGEAIPKLCYFFDYRHFNNRDDDNFPADVAMHFYDFGPALELLSQGQIEVGTGIGIMHSKSVFEDESGTSEVGMTRVTVPFARIVVQPLSLIPGLEKERAAAFFKWYVRWTWIPGTMDPTDFGVPSARSSFSASNEVVRSMGFVLDPIELFRK